MITEPRVLHVLGTKLHYVGQAHVDEVHGILTPITQLSPPFNSKAEALEALNEIHTKSKT